MKTSITCLTIFLILGLAAAAWSAERTRVAMPGQEMIHGGLVGVSKAARDTIVVMGPWGSGAPYNGEFQTPDGAEAWNGWTHADLTVLADNHWQVSDYNAFGLNEHGAENLAAWNPDT